MKLSNNSWQCLEFRTRSEDAFVRTFTLKHWRRIFRNCITTSTPSFSPKQPEGSSSLFPPYTL